MNEKPPGKSPEFEFAADPSETDESSPPIEGDLKLADTGRYGKLVNKLQPDKGYNPYNTGVYDDAEAKKKAPRKPTDLRKLSEWIKTQRKVQQLKEEDPDKDPQ